MGCIAGILDLKYRDIPASIVMMGFILGVLGAQNMRYFINLGIGIGIYGPWYVTYRKWKQGIAEGDVAMLPVLGSAFWWDAWSQFHIFTNTLIIAAPYAIYEIMSGKKKDVPLVWFGFLGVIVYTIMGNVIWWVLSS